MLVVAPKQVAEHVWPAETARWRPDLSLASAVGTPNQRAAAVSAASAGHADITVLGRDNLPWLLSTKGPVPKYRTIVLDESQSYKTRSSARWKAARKLTKDADQVWALTGTPAGNGLMDLWAQLYLIDNGQRLGTTITGFRQRYFYPEKVLPNGVVAKWSLKPGAEEAIYAAISDICLHIPLTGLDLPDLTVNAVPVGLPPAVMATYARLKKDMIADIDLLGGPEVLTVPTAAVLSNKLSQVTAGALYADDGSTAELHSAKLDQLVEIVDQTEGGVLVFYRFKSEAKRILEALPQATMVTAKGAIDAWNRGEIPVMVAHPASAGHGLNLQYGGSTIVWTSLSWDMSEWAQANARLHRQGQTDRVMVHVLTVPGTIDVEIMRAIEGKVSVQQALLDALTT